MEYLSNDAITFIHIKIDFRVWKNNGFTDEFHGGSASSLDIDYVSHSNICSMMIARI